MRFAFHFGWAAASGLYPNASPQAINEPTKY